MENTFNIVFSSAVILFVWIMFINIRKAIRPNPLKEASSKNRKVLVSRMRLKQQGPPILCEMHAQSLQIGQMAFLDASRCELCTKSPINSMSNKKTA